MGLQNEIKSRLPSDVTPELDPDELLRQAQNGSPDWGAIFGCVFKPMSRAARSALWRMGVQDPHAVDDAVVLGFEKLQNKGLDECTNLISYARSFAYRAGQRIARQLRSQWKQVTNEPSEEVDDGGPLIEDLLITTEEEAERQELLERQFRAAVECLESLTPGEREAVVEVEMKGKSDSQLAEETGVSHTAVWKRRTKGLAKLKDCVERKLAAQELISEKELSDG